MSGSTPLDAKVLGQLLLLQNLLYPQPNPEAIRSFVCIGLLNVPGVRAVTHEAAGAEKRAGCDMRIDIASTRQRHGVLCFELSNTAAFAPYVPYLRDFGAMVGVILDEREAREKNESLLAHLEERVRERTRQLSIQVAEKTLLAANLETSLAKIERMAAALTREQTFSTDAINSLPGVFYAIDEDGRVCHWNRKLETITGYSADELRGKPALELIAHADRPLVAERITEVFVRGESSVDANLQEKSGRSTLYRFNGCRSVIGGRTYLIGQGSDISERRRLEQQVEEIAELNRKILSSSPVGMAAYRINSGRCVMTNLAFARMIGAPQELILRENFREIDFWRKSGLLGAAQRAMRDDTEVRHQVRTVSGFGQPLSLEAIIVPFVSQGEPHLLLMTEDTTERRRAQQEQLRAVLDASPDAMLLVIRDEAQARIELANIEAEKLFGYSGSELKRQQIVTLLPTLDLGDMDAHHEMPARMADGRELPVETTLSHLQFDGMAAIIVTVSDISARKDAENRLKASEQRFRSLTQLGADWYWEQDAEFRFTAVSGGQKYYDSFQNLSLIGKTRWELPHDEEGEECLKWTQHRACLARHEPFRNFEIRRRDTHGRLRVLMTSGEPLFADDGTFIGYRGVSTDVTERYQAEEALRESEFRWKFALEGAGDGVWDWNLETGKLHFSKRWKEMLGYADEDIGDSIGDWQRCVLPEDMTRAMVTLEAYLDNREPPPFSAKYRMLCKDGSWRTVLSRGMVVNRAPDGRPLRMIGTHTDITEMTKVQNRLQTLSRAVENSPAVVVITDPAGNIEYVNPRFVAVTGYPTEEVIGRTPRILKSGRQNPEIYARLWSTILSGQEWHGELFNRKKSGEIFLEDVTITPIRDEKGVITHFVSVKQDITAQRNAELELLKARDAAENANLAKSQFLANMSHEIRTPLNAIMGLSHLCLNTELTPKQTDYLKKIGSAAHSLHGIVSDILDFSKIEAGKFDLDEMSFEFAEILDNLTVLFADKAEQKGLKFHLEAAADIPTRLVGDPLRLGQILINLVGNAIKFTDEGGKVAVTVTLLERTAERVHLRFSVRDSGIGIPDEQLKRLFQSFSQADASITRRYGGTGLGLAISRHLVTLMGGRIDVVSAPGQGSEFSLCVPFDLAAPPQTAEGGEHPAHASAAEAEKIAGARILLVEDNEINRQVVSELLEQLGVRVVTADHGEQALALLATERFDGVLMDMQMPVMDGVSATRAIRTDPRHRHLPIIALTANARPADRENCLAAGMNDHIPKPVDLVQLIGTLARWIVPTAPTTLLSPPPARIAPAQAHATLPEDDLDTLVRLAMEQLEEFDSAVEDSLARMRGLVTPDSPQAHWLAGIERLVLAYDYETALARLRQWGSSEA